MAICTYCGRENDDAVLTCRECGTSVVSIAEPEPRRRPGFHVDETYERIRREVHAEFDSSIRQAAGVRKWWLIWKRQRRISRRLSQLIHASFSPKTVAPRDCRGFNSIAVGARRRRVGEPNC